MAKISLIFLLSFVLIHSTQFVTGHGEKIEESIESGLNFAGDATKEITSSLAGGELHPDELRKIDTEIKEAFKNMKNAFNEALSPSEKESSENDEEFDPLEETDGDAPSSENNEELAPPSDDGDAPSLDGGEELALSLGDSDIPSENGHDEKIKESIESGLNFTGDATKEITSSLAGGELHPDELRKICTEIKEAFKNMKSAFNEALSPSEKYSSEDDEELAPLEEIDGEAPSSENDEELAPPSDDGDAPSLDCGEELALSLEDSDIPSEDGEEPVSLSKDDF
ncbi:hypothetical protein GQ457_09G004280 [Hibiscus cannabinus]